MSLLVYSQQRVLGPMNGAEDMKDQKLQALQGVDLFAKLSHQHLNALGQVTDKVTVAADRDLLTEGSVATHMSIIIDGEAAVHVGGKPIVLLGAGDVVGEFAMIDDEPTSATVTTTAETTIWHIARSGFTPIWDRNPEMARPLLDATIAKLRDTNVAMSSSWRKAGLN